MASGPHLNNHHRDTLARLFDHPASANIEWREVLSLLEAVGTVSEEHNGKFKLLLGPTVEFIERPRGKDIDLDLVVELRRILRQAGIEPAAAG